ncbi:F-box/WD repeat-containing protein 7 isoform X1 [Molossus molossus]|uniref:F-box/WD repeat-containing protein 7 n=2 Tax=Molossus molossus TaxID=27622 RepID=A0A7J8I6N6_MOLMO|nr:F-box/WD repeat-containing protein 7 isoform X1 [Molossus molossus]XP_036097914.1 F-box/WD repeat-containing protein 7 isoform X1 [Molossus molossus]XP_036097915.1 F-box/WD repeat-containing protein 7 isoform X1 [Molossus molossus]KAF6479968.1 F-box and WD repeat domain containing 7 [Molossus molossus]
MSTQDLMCRKLPIQSWLLEYSHHVQSFAGRSLEEARPGVNVAEDVKNVKTFASSDSLAKVQEVASWLLEMNQELLSVGSKRRRTGGSLRGNPSSSQADEEQMNRVVEEEQQQQQLRQPEEEHTARNGEIIGAEPRPGDQNDSQQGQLEENNNRFISVDEDSSGNQEEPEEDEERAGEQDEEDEEEEEMDQESDDFDQSDDSSREDEHTHSNSVTNSSSIADLPIHQFSSPFYTKTTKMKRKLDHGSEVRSFSLGKKPCKVSEYTSTTGLVPCSATPTTFGDLRAANGQGQQRRRITSVQPPTGLQEWLKMFQSWSGPEKLLALDELIDSCEPTQVKHMMQVIEPQFQRDFISLLPKELALYVLSFLEPKDLLQAAQTCRYWRILAEDNLLWREKCKEEGIDEPLHIKRRKVIKPGFIHSPWKSAYIRQHRIDTNWRRGELKSPKVLKGHDDHVITCLQFCGNRIVSGSDDNTLKVWSAVTGKCLRTLVGHTGGVWSSQMRDNIIISGSTDRTLKVWNAETGECIHTLYGHTSTVRCMHLHEKRVVSGSRDATLRVWDIETGQCLHVLMGHVAAVRCVQYDGRRVVSGAYDFMVKVWDPETETCLHTLQGHTNRVYSLQFDGIHVVSGSLDTSIRVWDVETGNCIHTLTGHQSLTSGMELKDNILVSGNADSTVKIWDIKTGQCLQTLQGPNKHQSAVTCLQFNKNFVITSSDDGTVKLWDLKTGEFIRNLVTLESGGSGGVVWRIRASNTKLVCAVGSRNGTEETKLLVLDFDVDMK